MDCPHPAEASALPLSLSIPLPYSSMAGHRGLMGLSAARMSGQLTPCRRLWYPQSMAPRFQESEDLWSLFLFGSTSAPHYYNLVLVKAQLGEPFLGFFIFFSFFVFIHIFPLFPRIFPSFSESRHLRDQYRHLSSQTGTEKRTNIKRSKPALKCRNRHLTEALGQLSLE